MIWIDKLIPADEIRICKQGNYIYITEDEYTQFVTDLEAKARELWPELFESDRSFKNVERDDGLTDTVSSGNPNTGTYFEDKKPNG